jgi:hypothetical protein
VYVICIYVNKLVYNFPSLQSENIRTIIKARGLAYPNVTGRTSTIFRVDRKNNLFSFVSRIGKMLL